MSGAESPSSSSRDAALVLSRHRAAALAVLIVVGVGAADYLTGHEISLSTFYLLAVSLATWFVARWFGVVVSLLSVVASFGGDLAAGAQFSSPLIPCWNALIGLGLYLVVVWLLAKLRSMHAELEERVRQRTAALTREIGERASLEKEILEISEREQRRISHDLHDSLCQHLTATALAGQVLDEKLAARLLPESADAAQIVTLLEEGIALARNIARGLHPIEMDSEGLMSALEEMAASVTDRFKVDCRFEFDSPVTIDDPGVAMHLYRITQEALTNAVRHAKARSISIRLTRKGDQAELTVADDGVGLPPRRASHPGLGIRIMAHRASMIRAAFDVRPGAAGGTVVTCVFPNASFRAEHAFS
jgi:signal transduction histidine kinase